MTIAVDLRLKATKQTNIRGLIPHNFAELAKAAPIDGQVLYDFYMLCLS